MPSSTFPLASQSPHAGSGIEAALQQGLFGGEERRYVDVDRIVGREMPTVLRLMMENVVRTLPTGEREAAVAGLLGWLDEATSTRELELTPGRILMHDTTSTPALVDIAAMRDVLAAEGLEPGRLGPVLPVEVSVDHSLAVASYGRADAATRNLEREVGLNRERYTFLKWAAASLPNVHINPPGTGIMHTINLEQLATVATTQTRDGDSWAVPDVMIGTDSHTPMVNALGVLGWGVGGLEAQTVMFGMPVSVRIPDVVGVRLTGALPAGSTATDLALTITSALREMGVTGEFVEFFGPGVGALSVGTRAVIANMAPEYGATTGYFPVDGRTLEYLRATGRSAAHVRFVEEYHRRSGLWFEPDAEPRFTRTLDLDLSTIGTTIAGPRRPQDMRRPAELPALLAAEVDASRAEGEAARSSGLPQFPVALASITSCTNTTDPALLLIAGLLAQAAQDRGLRAAPWVKTSLAPGSPAAASYLARSGLKEGLAAVGFDIVGFGCTTCIGNSGALPDPITQALSEGTARPVAALSGNRNFPGRVHPDLDLGLLMSPPLVVAFALAGRADIDISRDILGIDDDGREVRLADLWPSEDALASALAKAMDSEDFGRDFAAASASALWRRIEAPHSDLFPWQEDSTTLRRPPFADAADPVRLGPYHAHALLSLGDDVTTDHISPASAIPDGSEADAYLRARGDAEANVFASYRGNWEVMVRGSYVNRTLVNRLAPGAPTGHTLHAPSGDVVPLTEAARRYREAGDSVVVVAGERYGMGSSRDWAAKAPWLLGVRAVLADSFERIHRTNLIGMGILPLLLPHEAREAVHAVAADDVIEIDAAPDALDIRGSVPVRIARADGTETRVTATAAVETAHEVRLLRAGGVIPTIVGRERQASVAGQAGTN